jgi:hypothetical protein
VASIIADIQLLLAASRDFLESDDLDVERLKAWGAERDAIFCRLKEQKPLLVGFETATFALLRELLDLDGTICKRLIEQQRWLAKQIAAARLRRQEGRNRSSGSPRFLERAV